MDAPTGKRCTKCGETKPVAKFHRNRLSPDGLACWCKECLRAVNHGRYVANLEDSRKAKRKSARLWRNAHPEYARHQRSTNRAMVLDHYGHECACCGSTENLTLDHVNGDGKQHRAEIGGSGSVLYGWLVANDFPVDPPLQVLCFPCNKSKGTGDRCRLDHQAADAA